MTSDKLTKKKSQAVTSLVMEDCPGFDFPEPLIDYEEEEAATPEPEVETKPVEAAAPEEGK